MPSVVRISPTGLMFYRDYTCITIVPGTPFTKTICSAPAHLQHGAHSYRLISTDHRALSSKPAGRRYLRDRRTDTRPLHRPRLACAHTVGSVGRRTVGLAMSDAAHAVKFLQAGTA